MMYDKNFNVRNNTRNLFAIALSEEKDTDKDKIDSEQINFDKMLNIFIRKGLYEETKVSKAFVAWMDSI